MSGVGIIRAERSDTMKQKRLFYLDVARVIAIISISLNHAVNRSYQNYSGQMAEFFAIPMASTLFKMLISVFSRIGVPLFLMITGVLILNKKMEQNIGMQEN
jgi:surface polysaccharide O-acyltransferase-like enzyme